MITPFRQLDLSLVPGPSMLVEPALSFDMHDVVEYPPEFIARTVLSIPNTRRCSANDVSWWDWKVRYDAPDGTIDMNMTLFETETPSWGGSLLNIECGVESLIDFWCRIRDSCSAVWLHDTDCNLYSPERFRKLYL